MSAPVDLLVELDVDGVWTDVTAYVRVGSHPQITRGLADEQSAPGPAKLTLALNNKDGRFSPRNPTGPYYGLFGRNTLIRVTSDISGTPAVRFVGEVASWPPSWDYSEADVWVSVEAAGIRRRLGSGRQQPIQDVLTRFSLAEGGTLGYWPMSDPEGSTAFAALKGPGPITPAGLVDFAANSAAFPALPVLPTFTAGSASSSLSGAATGVGVAGAVVWVPSGLGGVTHTLLLLRFTGGTVGYAELGLLANTGQVVVSLYNTSGVFIAGASTGLVDDIRNRAVRLQMSVWQNGAAVDMELAVTALGGSITTYTDTIAATTLGAISGVEVGTDTMSTRTLLAGVSLGQLVVGDELIAAGDWASPLGLYSGELADHRIFRLCTEESVPWANGGPSYGVGAALGPQLPGTLLGLLDEAAASDGGVLTEQVDDLGLVYTSRYDLYDQAPAAALSYSGAQLDEFTPVEDDQAIVNDLTVTRVGGSSARFEQTVGALSVLPPPDGVGRYAANVDLSLASDAQLPDQAAWRVSLGTIDQARYPAVGFDLVASREFTAGEADDVLALREGDLITIAGPPSFAGPPDTIRALVLGWREAIGTHTYRMVLVTRPASGFDVVELDDTQYGRLDSATTVTSEALDTTETGVDYTGDTWITTASHPAEFPFDIVIGGEEMRVNSATGTTFTVTRSLNGVVKSHLTGAVVRLAEPNRLAL